MSHCREAWWLFMSAPLRLRSVDPVPSWLQSVWDSEKCNDQGIPISLVRFLVDRFAILAYASGPEIEVHDKCMCMACSYSFSRRDIQKPMKEDSIRLEYSKKARGRTAISSNERIPIRVRNPPIACSAVCSKAVFIYPTKRDSTPLVCLCIFNFNAKRYKLTYHDGRLQIWGGQLPAFKRHLSQNLPKTLLNVAQALGFSGCRRRW